MRELVDGNAAIARGALDAGCDFFAGYPITPATPILLAMMRELPRRGGIAIQGEDEIASLGFCIGAAMTGRRAFTATSGPGISLYSENIGLAIMGEVPLVIVDVQRLGPATGGATTVAQGDAQFIRWCTSGGYPIVALCPASAADAYALTLRAFDWAERFRCPIFLVTDKEVASTLELVELPPRPTSPQPVSPPPNLPPIGMEGRGRAYPSRPPRLGQEKEPVSVRERVLADEACRFEPCDYPSPDQNVPMSPFGGPHLLRFTTSTHDERGYITKDPAKVARLNQHLVAKIEAHQDELELVRADYDPEAEVLLLSYGVTARAMDEAVRVARGAGWHVSTLTLLTLWPLPEGALRRAMALPIRRVVVAELNDGQMCREVERLACGGPEVVGLGRFDGELITPEQILQAGGLA
jgi:2-oxoglutarate ferredoxin oxidoreductase subunit alpha